MKFTLKLVYSLLMFIPAACIFALAFVLATFEDAFKCGWKFYWHVEWRHGPR